MDIINKAEDTQK